MEGKWRGVAWRGIGAVEGGGHREGERIARSRTSTSVDEREIIERLVGQSTRGLSD